MRSPNIWRWHLFQFVALWSIFIMTVLNYSIQQDNAKKLDELLELSRAIVVQVENLDRGGESW
jgi:hypothetical protein